MATVTGPLSVGTLVKAATHASASSQYGKKISSSTKGTAASGWVWDTANIATGKKILASNLKQQTTSHKITVSWTVPQKGVIISCTGCATATNSTAYTGSKTFTCTSAGSKTVTVALSGGSSQNCGQWYSTTAVTVSAGSTGTTNVALKLPLYYTYLSNARNLKIVSAAGAAYTSYCSLSYANNAVTFTNMPYAVHSGFGPSTALYTGQYSRIYAAVTVSALTVLNSNLSSDGQPWVNETYAITFSSGGTKSPTTKPYNTAHYVCLSTAAASATIKVTSWYAN